MPSPFLRYSVLECFFSPFAQLTTLQVVFSKILLEQCNHNIIVFTYDVLFLKLTLNNNDNVLSSAQLFRQQNQNSLKTKVDSALFHLYHSLISLSHTFDR